MNEAGPKTPRFALDRHSCVAARRPFSGARVARLYSSALKRKREWQDPDSNPGHHDCRADISLDKRSGGLVHWHSAAT